MVFKKLGPPATYHFNRGDRVYVDGKECAFIEMSDFYTALVKVLSSDEITEAHISDVEPFQVVLNDSPAIDAVPEEGMKLAMERYKAIEPLIDLKGRTRDVVEERGKKLNIHPSTLYNWLHWYEQSGKLTSLAPRSRNDKGKKKLSDEVEYIVQSLIETEYLSPQKKSIPEVYKKIKRHCYKKGLTVPHINTLRNRIKEISPYIKTKLRHSDKEANDSYGEIKGSFPGADFPLAVVEIDHTQVDLILVDDIHRQAIGRPWITLAMDVYSRMVVGFYISFDRPGYVGTGLSIYRSIVLKDKWLAEMGIKSRWPCYGTPKTIHVDNAKEFRSTSFENACAQYAINIEWRPVGRPQFGPHIERLLGNFAQKIHNLPGSTFSNVQQRGRYKSEKKASLTLSEFEEWLTIYITQVYHEEVHSSLNMTPYKKYKQGTFGDDHHPGVGTYPKFVDEDALLLDFMPMIKRSIQRDGVSIDKVKYWSDVLRRWINCPDSESSKLKRKFIFRRDPRDISVIWFFDPELEGYYSIPYRDISHPPISIWEFRKIKKDLENAGQKDVDERKIFEAYDRMDMIEKNAVKQTKAIRLKWQKRVSGLGVTKNNINQHKKNDSNKTSNDCTNSKELKPFENIYYVDDI
ncbi:Mu transposase C-terminal domain-containing protein [Maridesulfovibrio sp.]|uniref:Mu transposase C-terminal domain-containing protein n=1 Tax=Maridesulfovibrio sp. TaxID=2795000 RepID=UPI002A18D7C3|nr:Mu transposase C-terminal domain-containing protein [Maridesulfovibrio sp.]